MPSLPPCPAQSFSVFLGLSLLLGWHVWLVVTASGTIDAMAAVKVQKRRSVVCVGPEGWGLDGGHRVGGTVDAMAAAAKVQKRWSDRH